MLNSTCFKSDTVRCKIYGAMRRSMYSKSPQIISNKKGHNCLRIERLSYVDSGRIFRFTDKNGYDVTEAAYNGLRS